MSAVEYIALPFRLTHKNPVRLSVIQWGWYYMEKWEIRMYKKIEKILAKTSGHQSCWVLSLKVGKAKESQEKADNSDLILGIKSSELEEMPWIMSTSERLIFKLKLKENVFTNDIFAATFSFSSHTTGCWSELNTSLHKPQQPWKAFF